MIGKVAAISRIKAILSAASAESALLRQIALIVKSASSPQTDQFLQSRFEARMATTDVAVRHHLLGIYMRRNRSRRLRLEQLEARWLLATSAVSLPAEAEGQASPTSLVGRVFEDIDASGLDEEEPGLADMLVELFRDGGDGRFGADGSGADAAAGMDGDDDQLIAIVETEADSGRFAFSEIETGTYYVRQVTPDGFVLTTTDIFHSAVIQNSMNEVRGLDGLGFGLTVPGSISGLAFDDLHGDGKFTPDFDQLLSGIEFTLRGTDGLGNSVQRTATTDESGEFVFGGLLPSIQGRGLGTGYSIDTNLADSRARTSDVAFSSGLRSGEALVAYAGQARLESDSRLVEVVIAGMQEMEILPSNASQIRPVGARSIYGFGNSVHIDGNLAIVGAPGFSTFDPLGPEGAAFIFQRDPGTNDWTELQRLSADAPVRNGEFGDSVVIDEEKGYALVSGRPREHTAPAVYFYVREQSTGEWRQSSVFSPSESFFRTMSHDGDRLLLGGGSDASFLFTRDADTGLWNETKKFMRSGNYGKVSLSGSTAVITSDDIVYVFEEDQTSGDWAEVVALTGGVSMTASGEQFGVSISLDGDQLAVGAPGRYGSRTSRVHLFVRDPQTHVWSKQSELVGPDNSMFGRTVNLEGSKLLVTAGYTLPPHFEPERQAYIFLRNTENGNWDEVASIDVPTFATDFGAAASISGAVAFIAAPGTDYQSTPKAGTVYVYSNLHLITRAHVAAPFEPKQSLNFGVATLASIHGQYYDDVNADRFYSEETDLPRSGSKVTLTGIDSAGNAIDRTTITDDRGEFGFKGLLPSVYRLGKGSGYTVSVPIDADRGEIATTATSVDIDLESGQALVARTGQAELPPEDLRHEIVLSGPSRYVIPQEEVAETALDEEVETASIQERFFYRDSATGLWHETQRIPHPPIQTPLFATNGTTAFIGSTLEGSGAVYVAEFNAATRTWEQSAKLSASNARHNAEFGYAIALDRGVAVIGTRYDSAYVFEFDSESSSWREVAELSVPNAKGFGRSVSVSDNRIIVGAPLTDTAGHVQVGDPGYIQVGAAFVFERNVTTGEWQQVAELGGSGGYRDQFGSDVKLSGNTIMVSEGDSSEYLAYVFSRDDATGTWSRIQRFAGGDYTNFTAATSVQLDGDFALMGRGWATTFKRNRATEQWTEVTQARGVRVNATAIGGQDLLVIRNDRSPSEVLVGAFDKSLRFGTMNRGSIAGVVFHDRDGNGIYDPTLDVVGSGIELRLGGRKADSPNVVTNDQGEFIFEGLVPSLTEDPFSSGLLYGDGYDISPANPAFRYDHPYQVATTPIDTIGLSSGESHEFDSMIGVTRLAEIHGIVFEDANGNGVFDQNEGFLGSDDLGASPVTIVTVKGVDGSGSDVTLQAPARASFEFKDLLPSVVGTGNATGYTIEIAPPSSDDIPTTSLTRTLDVYSGDILVHSAGQASLHFLDPRSETQMPEVLAFGFRRKRDFGDAPESYGTTTASHDPGGRSLGLSRDGEFVANVSADATGDSGDGDDDEDGVLLPDLFVSGVETTITIHTTGVGGGHFDWLTGWIDWNANGRFEQPTEQVVSRGVFSGEYQFQVTPPLLIDPQIPRFARFRVSSDRNLTPTAPASDGEVEDYLIKVGLPDLHFTKSSSPPSGILVADPWTWKLAVFNNGNAPAVFEDGQVILRDNFPTENISYGATQISQQDGIGGTGRIDCATVADQLTCVAVDGTVVFDATGGSLQIELTDVVTKRPGLYSNPITGGTARVDPDDAIVESDESNNAASHTVEVRPRETTVEITSDTSKAIRTNTPFQVDFAVLPGIINGLIPTGQVTVTDGVDQCVGMVAAGSCTLSLSTPGQRTLTAVYEGDTAFNGNVSKGAQQFVGLGLSAEVSPSGSQRLVIHNATPDGIVVFVQGTTLGGGAIIFQGVTVKTEIADPKVVALAEPDSHGRALAQLSIADTTTSFFQAIEVKPDYQASAVLGSSMVTQSASTGDAEGPPNTLGQNPANPLDVNADGVVAPIDALIVINELNGQSATGVGVPRAQLHANQLPVYYHDVNGDGFVSPLDALVIINALISGAATVQLAEGESPMPVVIPVSQTIHSATIPTPNRQDAKQLSTTVPRAAETPALSNQRELRALNDRTTTSLGEELDDTINTLAEDVAITLGSATNEWE